MKLYECLKEVINKKLIVTIHLSENIEGKYFIKDKIVYLINDNLQVSYIESFNWITLFKEIELLDSTLEENKPYYEALDKVVE